MSYKVIKYPMRFNIQDINSLHGTKFYRASDAHSDLLVEVSYISFHLETGGKVFVRFAPLNKGRHIITKEFSKDFKTNSDNITVLKNPIKGFSKALMIPLLDGGTYEERIITIGGQDLCVVRYLWHQLIKSGWKLND
jgi:hypothetical protein